MLAFSGINIQPPTVIAYIFPLVQSIAWKGEEYLKGGKADSNVGNYVLDSV